MLALERCRILDLNYGIKRGDLPLLGIAAYAAPVISPLMLVLAGIASATVGRDCARDARPGPRLRSHRGWRSCRVGKA